MSACIPSMNSASISASSAERSASTCGVAYSDPKLTKTAGDVNRGMQATGVPKFQAKLGVEWDVPAVQGLTLTGNATAVSKQYISADNTLSVPGRVTYDLGARYATKVSGRR